MAPGFLKRFLWLVDKFPPSLLWRLFMVISYSTSSRMVLMVSVTCVLSLPTFNTASVTDMEEPLLTLAME
ncbi:MAG TPA: hypothetical protein DEQ34_02205 [Balneolaceae bacterium]|nr:hypothetical protein [Balneolaceae bacterium]